VSKADTDDWIEISVTDTGPGVPREHLDDIFKPYFTTRQDDGGTGLGLTVCRALACQLGGTLTAETVPGIGARFTLLLPTFGGATSDDDEVDRKLAPPSDRPLEVLVVDDEVLIRRVIARTLDARPVEYELAVDAEEALELAATERRFDVLVTDLSMPGMSGTTLIETLFERDQLPPAVFVMTGKRTDLGDMSCVVDVSVFEKPFTPADLLSALRVPLRRLRSGLCPEPGCVSVDKGPADVALPQATRALHRPLVGLRAGPADYVDSRGRARLTLFATRPVEYHAPPWPMHKSRPHPETGDASSVESSILSSITRD